MEARTVRAIREETDGNPFFVKQLVRHLEEDGRAGELHAEGGFGVPAGVRDVIARRVARLPEAAGRVLGVAALIGRDFDYELLEPVTGVPEDELLDVLDAAVRAGLVAEVPRTPGRYSFAHALLRTTLASELSATRRARLHLRIGEAIERCHRGRLDPWLDELARHFGEAGPQAADRAVDYAERAADQAASRLAYDEAARLLAHAVELRRRHEPADLAELARLESALAAAEKDAGRWRRRARDLRPRRWTRRGRRARSRPSRGRRSATPAAPGSTTAREDPESVALLEEALERLPQERLAAAGPGARAARGAPLLRGGRRGAGPGHRRPRRWRWRVVTGDPDAMVGGADRRAVRALAAGRAASDRLAIADELVGLTEQRGALGCAAEAHLWRAMALVELCRIDEADADLARHAEIAERLQQPPAARPPRRAARDARAAGGRLRARRRGRRRTCATWADRAEAPRDADDVAARLLRRGADRDPQRARRARRLVAPFFEQMAREMAALPGLARSARLGLGAGRPRARRRAARSRTSSPTTSRRSRATRTTWPRWRSSRTPSASCATPSSPRASSRSWTPFADSWVVLGPGASTLGPVAYCLGMLQLVQDRHDEAAASFERALELSASDARAPVRGARRCAGLAEALRRRGEPGDEARADELSARARAEARALGMRRLERELDQAPVAS